MRRPNILFIFTDQQTADIMSCAGNPYLHTPHMDSLAARGMRFTQAFCAQPLCCPQRGAMSTGKYPHQFGVPFNYHFMEREARGDLHWMGRVFRDAGYETAYFGKWHQPIRLDRSEVHGWDRLDVRLRDRDIPETCTLFFNEQRDKPFHLILSFMNPHNICECSRDAEHLPDGDIGPLPASEECPPLRSDFSIPENEPDAMRWFYTSYRSMRNKEGGYPTLNWNEARWRQFYWQYLRLTEKVDAQIGLVLKALEDSGQADNTVIIFTSDHGEMAGAHKWNQKQCLYDDSIHVPFIVVDPRQVKNGLVDTDHLVNTGLDILPTMCDYAGTTVPDGLTGLSVRPLTEGRAVPWRDHMVVETDFGHHSFPAGIRGRSVVTREYQYILYSTGQIQEQLFDRVNDPDEQHSLVDSPEHRAVLEQHRELLKAWADETDDHDFAYPWHYIK